MTAVTCAREGDAVKQRQRRYRIVGLVKRLALLHTINAARPRYERLAQLRERELQARSERLPMTGFHERVLQEGRGVEIERAVQINAALNRKRAALAEERRIVLIELEPIVLTLTRLRAAELVVKAKEKEVAQLLVSAAESRDESASEERGSALSW